MADQVHLENEEILFRGKGTLKRSRFSFERRDGKRQTRNWETYDIGDAAAVLPFDRTRGTVLLVRQFRWAAYSAGRPGDLIEAIAGKLDGEAPEETARREAMEETGYRIHDVQTAFIVFSTPGSVTEQLHCFVAAYEPSDRISGGGGAPNEGEDIEVLELQLDEALEMAARGEIVDAKTILLLQHLALQGPQSRETRLEARTPDPGSAPG